MDHRRMTDPAHPRASDFRFHHSLFFYCLLIVGAYFLTHVDGQESSENVANATAKKTKDVCQ
ncbi:hypothetical protein AAVH_12804, partial [Aphelenchoides avenae]